MVSESVIWFVLVAAIWGFTTPLLRHGSVGIDKVRGKTFIHRWINELRFLATNWKYVLVFLINQSGSLIYALALGPADLSFAVPITNALTFIFTTIAGRLVGETEKNFKSTLGIGLVASGIVLCILDKAWS